MKRSIAMLLAYLGAGVGLALVAAVAYRLAGLRHPSFALLTVGMLYVTIGLFHTESESLASKSCAYQRSVSLDCRVQEVLAAGTCVERAWTRILASHLFGVLFLLAAYCWP